MRFSLLLATAFSLLITAVEARDDKALHFFQAPWEWKISLAEGDDPTELMVRKVEKNTHQGDWVFDITWVKQPPYNESWVFYIFYTGSTYRPDAVSYITPMGAPDSDWRQPDRMAIRPDHEGFTVMIKLSTDQVMQLQQSKSLMITLKERNRNLILFPSTEDIKKPLARSLQNYHKTLAMHFDKQLN